MMYRSQYVISLSFYCLFLVTAQPTFSDSIFVANPYKENVHCVPSHLINVRMYEPRLMGVVYNVRQPQKNETKKDKDSQQQQNLFFKGFSWVAEHIADGIGYFIDDDNNQPVQKLQQKPRASPSIKKKLKQKPQQAQFSDSKKEVSQKITQRESKSCTTKYPLVLSLSKPTSSNQKSVKYYQAVIEEYEHELGCEQESYSDEHVYKKARLHALHETLKDPHIVHEKLYEFSEGIETVLHKHEVIMDDWHYCYGTPIQQHIHQEFITVTEQILAIKTQRGQETPHKSLTDTIINFADLGIAYNHVNHIVQSCSILDFCWGLKDSCCGLVEGLWDVGCALREAANHPIESGKAFLWRNIVHPATHLGHALSKAMRALDDLGYIQFLKFIGKKELAEQKYHDFLQRVIAFDDRLQAKLKMLGDDWQAAKVLGIRNLVRHATPNVLEGYVTGKALTVFCKLSNIARVQALSATKKIVDKVHKLSSVEVIAVTVEGIELPIVAESMQFLIETEKKIGGASQLPLSELQRKFKIVIEGIEEILPEVAKANRDKILHVLQSKHVWDRLVHDPKDWDAVARIISKVLREGIQNATKTPFIFEKVAIIGPHTVTVRFRKYLNEVSLSNAWINFI